MKFASTNATLIANEKMKVATIGQKGQVPAFVDEEHLEELRDLLNAYLEIKYEKK